MTFAPSSATDQSTPAVAASGTLSLIHYLDTQHALNRCKAEAILGVPLDTLTDPDLRLPVDTHYRLWDHAEEATGDPAVGLHAGEHVSPDEMGLVGHVFFNCATLGEAVSQYVRLYGLINQAITLSLEQTAELAILSWRADSHSHYSRQDMDRTLAAVINRAHHFIHPQLDIAWVQMGHAEPVYAREYERIVKCPVTFGGHAMQLAFSAGYLEHPIPHRNPYIHSAMLKQVNGLLARLQGQRRFSRKVRRLISRQIASEQMHADTLAKQLHMSRQTLYRRLRAEGLSFHELVEQVRYNKAMRHVAGDRYALGEIAFLLGFSELSAFSRAFKRWTGESPTHYRARHR